MVAARVLIPRLGEAHSRVGLEVWARGKREGFGAWKAREQGVIQLDGRGEKGRVEGETRLRGHTRVSGMSERVFAAIFFLLWLCTGTAGK